MSGDEMGAAFFAGNEGEKGTDADEALWVDDNGFAGEDWFQAARAQAAEEKDGGRSLEALKEAFAGAQQENAAKQGQALKASMAQAVETEPEEEAKIRALARQFNAPPELARRYRAQFEAQARNERMESLSAAYPKTAAYLSDPGHARLAHDDVDNITALEAMFTQPEGFSIAGDFGARADKARLAPLDFTVDAARNLAAGAIGGAIKTAGATVSYLARSLPVAGINPEGELYYQEGLTGDEQMARYGEAEKVGKALAASSGADQLYRFGKETEEAIAGEGMGEYGLAGRALLSGFRSLGNMVPATAGSFLTGSPVLPLVFAGLSEGGEAFMDDVLGGESLGKATLHGMVNGGIEAATEFLPLSKLIKDAAAGTPFVSMFLRNWARETPSELVATAGQTLSDRIAGMKEGEDAGDVFLKWLSELPENELETAISVIPMSLGFSGLARVHQAREARALKKTVETFNRLAGESRLRSRSPEDYAAMADLMGQGSGVTHAYIDAGKWITYFQEKGIDPQEAAKQYGALNYAEAAELGVSLMIPFGRYQAGFSASEHAAAFTANTKFDERALTATEGEEQKAKSVPNTALLAGMLHELGQESKTAGALGKAVEELTDEVAMQLVERYGWDDARVQASVFARAFVHPIFRDLMARAEEAGKTVSPEELVEDIRRRFVGYGMLVDANAQEGGQPHGQPLNANVDLDTRVPVIPVTPQFQGQDPKIVREHFPDAVREKVLAAFKEGVTNEQTGITVGMPESDFTAHLHFGDDATGDAHLEAIAVLPELMRTASLIESHEDKKAGDAANLKQVHRFISALRVGGKDYSVMLTVKEFKDGTTRLDTKNPVRLYHHGAEKPLSSVTSASFPIEQAGSWTTPEATGERPDTRGNQSPDGKSPRRVQADRPLTVTIRDLFSAVKDAEGDLYFPSSPADGGQQHGQPLNANVNPDMAIPVVDLGETKALRINTQGAKDFVNLWKGVPLAISQDPNGKVQFRLSSIDPDHAYWSSDIKGRNHETRRAALAALNRVLESAVRIEDTNPKHKGTQKTIRFYAAVSRKGKPVAIRIVAHEMAGQRAEIDGVELYDVIRERERPGTQGNQSPDGESPVVVRQAAPTTITIRDLLSGVKDAEGDLYFLSSPADGGQQYGQPLNANVNPDMAIPVVDLGETKALRINTQGAKDFVNKWKGAPLEILHDPNGKVKARLSSINPNHAYWSSDISGRNNKTRRAALAALNKVLENAVRIEDIHPKHKGTQKTIRFFAAVFLDGKTTAIRIVAHEMKGQHAEIDGVELYDVIRERPDTQGNQSPYGERPEGQQTAPTTVTIRDLFSAVKDAEGDLYFLSSPADGGQQYGQPLNANVNPDMAIPVVDLGETKALQINTQGAKDFVNLWKGAPLAISQDPNGKVQFRLSSIDPDHAYWSSDIKGRNNKTRGAALAALNRVLENAVRIEDTNPKHKGTQKTIRFFAAVSRGGKPVAIRIVAHEMKGQRAEIDGVELYDVIRERSGTQGNQSPDGESPVVVQQTAPATITIRDLLSGVKDAGGQLYFPSSPADGGQQYGQPLNANVNPDMEIPIVDLGGTKALRINTQGAKDFVNRWKGAPLEILHDPNGRVKARLSSIDPDHAYWSSDIKGRNDKTRRTALAELERILENAVRIEDINPKHKGTQKTIRFFAAVSRGGKPVAIRIVAHEMEGQRAEIDGVELYDIIKERGRPDTQGNQSPNGESPGGVQAGRPSSIKIRDLLSGVKDAYGKLYFPSSPADGGQQYGQPVQYERLDPVARQYLELAQADEGEIFRYKTSDKRDLQEILNDLTKGFKVSSPREPSTEEAKAGVRGRYDVVAPDGSLAWVYIYPDRKLAIDASRLHSKESEGSALIQAVANLAYNMGYRFEGDRAGLTPLGRMRAAEHMLSSALRYGTTRHLAPAKNLLTPGENGERAIIWEEGNDLANISQLIDLTYKNVRDIIPEIERFRYNFEKGQFEENDGKNWRAVSGNHTVQNGRGDGRALQMGAGGHQHLSDRPGDLGRNHEAAVRADRETEEGTAAALQERIESLVAGRTGKTGTDYPGRSPERPHSAKRVEPQDIGRTTLARSVLVLSLRERVVSEAQGRYGFLAGLPGTGHSQQPDQTAGRLLQVAGTLLSRLLYQSSPEYGFAEGGQQYGQPVTQGFYWEYGQREGLFDLPDVPVVCISGTEFGKGRKAIKAGAMAHLDKIRNGTPIKNHDTEWALQISRDDRSKIVKDPEQTLEALQAVFAIEQLAENAVLAESHEDEKYHNPDVQGIHRMYAPIEINGVLYRAKLTVRDYTGVSSGEKTNLHDIDTIEIERHPDVGSLSSASIDDNTGKITLPSERLDPSISDAPAGSGRHDGAAQDTARAETEKPGDAITLTKPSETAKTGTPTGLAPSISEAESGERIPLHDIDTAETGKPGGAMTLTHPPEAAKTGTPTGLAPSISEAESGGMDAAGKGSAPLGTSPTKLDTPIKTAQPTTGRTLSISALLAGSSRHDGTPWDTRTALEREAGDDRENTRAEPEAGEAQAGQSGFTASANPGAGMPAEGSSIGIGEVRQVAKALSAEYGNAPELVVVEKPGDLPFDALEDAKGVCRGGRCFLVQQNIASAADAREVFGHEVIGHYGLRGFFGKRLSPELKDIFFHNRNVREAVRKWIKDNAGFIRGVRRQKAAWNHKRFAEWRMLRATEEALAQMAQRGEKVTGVKKLVYAIQKCLRFIGLWQLANRLEAKTDAEALMALHKAELFVKSGKNVDTASVTDVYALFARSAMQSVTANIARGKAAMNKALLEKTSVHRAMFRNGLGWVDFVWGSTGRITESGRTKGAMGISPILEAMQRKDRLSETEAIGLLHRIVEVIARGEAFSRDEIGGSIRVGLESNGHVAWLTRQSGNNAWVVTGYEKTPGGQAAGRATALPTDATASRTRDGTGAGVRERSVSQEGGHAFAVTGFSMHDQVEAGRGATPSEPTQREPIRSRQTPGADHAAERPEAGRESNIAQDDDLAAFSRKGDGERGYTASANPDAAKQAAKHSVQSALEKVSADKSYTGTHKLMPVADWAVKAAADHGLDIAGFEHAIDGSAINHVMKNHGNAKTEASRGQVAITEEDFLLIPDIVSNPDKTVYGMKSDIGRDIIGYIKRMPDGTTLYLEEVRTGRKTLATQSMRKYPPTSHATSIEKSLRPTSKTASGEGISIVENPSGNNEPVPGAGMPAEGSQVGIEEVRQIAEALSAEYGNAPELVVVEKPADLPFDAFEDAKGVYWGGRCFLVQRNITSAEDAREVFGHEVIGHYGLRGFFGAQLSLELDKILFHNKNVREAAQKWVKNNGDYISRVRNKNPGWSQEEFTQWLRNIATEEALAQMAQRGEKVTGVKKLVHVIQKCLRFIGLWQLANRLEAKTDAEALMALHKAELFVKSGKNVDTASVTDVYALFARKGDGERGYTASANPSAAEQAEANRQYDEVVAKYKDSPLWLKAPNGEPTNLTEKQWVQARTENFKKAFGDWEKAGIRERLESQEPIPVKQVYTEETARIKKSEAAQLLKNNFSVKKVIGEVFVSRGNIRDSLGHSRNAAKLDVIPCLKEILEQATYLDTLQDFDGKEIKNHYFATRIQHGGQTKLVFLRVRKMPGTENQLYVHDVFVEEEIKVKAEPSQTRLNSEAIQILRSTSPYRAILQEIYSTVNLSISNIVDKNGEPAASCWGEGKESGGSQVGIEEVRQIAKALSAEYGNAPELVVVEKPGDLPFDAFEDAKGVYWGGRCFLVASNLDTAEDARMTFAHEVIGHYGLNGFFGKTIHDALGDIFFHNKNVQEAAHKWIKDNGDYISAVRESRKDWSHEQFTKWRDSIATEEALAQMAQRGEKVTGVKKLVHVIQRCLRVIGLWQLANRLEAKTDAEALMALHKAELFVKSGKNVDTATVTDVYALFARSAMQSVTANIARGKAAMNKALLEKTSVHRAMFRNGLGWVDFVWGSTGRITESSRTKGAMGISPILEARQRKDRLSETEAIGLLHRVVEVIARGEETQRAEIGEWTRVRIENEGNVVALAKRTGSNAFIITGFSMHDQVETGRGATPSEPTQRKPIRSRQTPGADHAAERPEAGRESNIAQDDDLAAFSRKGDGQALPGAAQKETAVDLLTPFSQRGETSAAGQTDLYSQRGETSAAGYADFHTRRGRTSGAGYAINSGLTESLPESAPSGKQGDDFIDFFQEDAGQAAAFWPEGEDALDEDPRVLHQFIGEKGAAELDRAEEATVRLDNLAVAREMEAAGRKAKLIKLATGWERGADGKWRYEISDAFLRLNLPESGKRTLGEALAHPELFTAYPDLKGLLVVREPILLPAGAAAFLDGNTIFVDDALSPRETRSALLHEVQHAIQEREGFATGASPDSFETNEKGLVDTGRKRRRYVKPDMAYKAVAGEVEARNTQRRAFMTPEQRMYLLAEETEDVARKDQIFLQQAMFPGDLQAEESRQGKALLAGWDKSGKQGTLRGALSILPDRKMRISLFKDANYSTFVHETAHFMLEVYRDLANAPGASAYIKKEYAAILRYLKAKPGQPITRGQHEMFARSFEHYLMEGKAPTAAMRDVFSRFKAWLLDIYKHFNSLNVPLSDDIRGVFDRMLATDREIAFMRQAREMAPLFASARAMGADEEAFAAYQEANRLEWQAAEDALRASTMRQRLREETKAYRKAYEQMRQRAVAAYDAQPAAKALYALTAHTGFSLNAARMRQVYGEDVISLLPVMDGRRIYDEKGDLLPEEAAGALGFDSGDEMVKAIARLEDREAFIRKEAKRLMLAREAEALHGETMAASFEDALGNARRLERLQAELGFLARLGGAGEALSDAAIAAQSEAMRQKAAAFVLGKQVKEMKPSLYFQAMQAAAHKAREAIERTRPDYGEAIRQKQAELMNLLLYREASRVLSAVRDGMAQAEAIAARPLEEVCRTRDALCAGKAKQLAAQLLSGGEAGTPRDGMRAEGAEGQADGEAAGPVEEMQAAMALDALQAVQAYWYLARRLRVMAVDGARVALSRAAGAVAARLRTFGRAAGKEGLPAVLAEDGVLSVFGGLRWHEARMAAFCERADGLMAGEDAGPLARYVFEPVRQAAADARKAQEEALGRLDALLSGFGFVRETIAAPELGMTFGKRTGYGKAELVHALICSGCVSGMARLVGGPGSGGFAGGRLDARRWEAFLSRMAAEGRLTRADYDRVQAILDVFAGFLPRWQQAHKALFGRAFDGAAPRGLTAFGKVYRGGFVPAADMGLPGAGGISAPFVPDLAALRRQLGEMVRFAFVAPAGRDVSLLLQEEAVQAAFGQYAPGFLDAVVKPWLACSLRPYEAAPGEDLTVLDGWTEAGRLRAGAAALLDAGAAALGGQGMGAAVLERVKLPYVTAAFQEMAQDRAQAAQAVAAASSYMQGRMRANLAAFSEGAGKDGALAADAGLLAAADMFCAPVVWAAAYHQASVEGGLSRADAVLAADEAVRQALGDAARGRLAWQDGGALLQAAALFKAYFADGARAGGDAAQRQAAVLLLQAAMLPVWSGAALCRAGGSRIDGAAAKAFEGWLGDAFGWGAMDGEGFSLAGRVVPLAGEGGRKHGALSGPVFYPPFVKLTEAAFQAMGWAKEDGAFDAARFAQDMAAFWETACGLADAAEREAQEAAEGADAFDAWEAENDIPAFSRKAQAGGEQTFYQQDQVEEDGERGYTASANPDAAERAAKNAIHDALGKASDKTYTDTHKLMPVADWAVKAAADHGLDIAGFEHAIDGSAIRHIIKNHGDVKAEANRGQVAITKEDFLLIPDIISNPDKTVYGAINDRGQDVIGYIKRMQDGTTVYLEEVRTGRKTLTSHTMWKYPPGHHATSIEKSLQHTARTEPGDRISIVEKPSGNN